MNAEIALERLWVTGEQYHAAVRDLFEIDERTKKCFAEGSPTTDTPTYERFVRFNDAGKRFSAALVSASRILGETSPPEEAA